MPIASACPDVPTLQRLLLGQLPPEEAERMERHLAGCRPCSETIRSVRAEDTLVEAVRVARRVLAEEPDRGLVEGLMRSLKQIAPGGATLPVPGTPAQTLPLSSAGTEPAGTTSELLAPPQQPGEIGRLGPYRILRLLGAGGMGVVFLADDPRLKRQVALKAIKPELAARPGVRRRFLLEVQATAAIEHDHIVTVFHADEDRGVPYLAMPLLKGEALEDRLRREQGVPLPVAEVLRIGREIAEGLAAAHDKGLVHRDVKPSNVWLEGERARVKVLDFGLARALGGEAGQTSPGAIVGTPAYMAPEQAQNGAVDARADLFSLGCVLYRLATGRPPFEGTDVISILLNVASQTPAPVAEVNPDLPPPLADLIGQLLAKRPGERPPSAHAVAEAIRAVETERDERARPRPSRRRWLVLTVLTAAGAAGLAAWLLRPAPTPPVQPGEVTFETEEPGLRVALRRGDGPETELGVKTGLRQTLPPGDYSLRLTEAREGRRLVPDRFTVAPGAPTTVALVLAGEVRRYAGHTGPVWGVALSPAGGLLALSASGDRSVAVWDAAGEVPRFLEGHSSAVRCVAFSADGRLALTGAGGKSQPPDLSARVWDLRTLREVGRFDKHDSWVTGVAFAPDGKRALCGYADGAAIVWDVKTGQVVFPLRGHEQGWVFGTFAPDGRSLLTGGGDHLMILWDAASGKVFKKLEGHTDAVRGVAFAPNGAQAASAGRDGTVRVWDLEGGRSRELRGHRGAVECVAFSPDGKRVLSGGEDRTVRLWDAADGTEVYRLEGHTGAVHGVAFAADGRRALSGGVDRTVRLWQLP